MVGAWDARSLYELSSCITDPVEKKESEISSGDSRSQDTCCASRLSLFLFYQWPIYP